MTVQGWTVCALLVCSVSAEAASFRCDRAALPVEQLICEDAGLSELDESMAGWFSKALQAVEAPGALRQSQREWLRERNLLQSGSALAASYEARIKTLRSIGSNLAQERGVWRGKIRLEDGSTLQVMACSHDRSHYMEFRELGHQVRYSLVKVGDRWEPTKSSPPSDLRISTSSLAQTDLIGTLISPVSRVSQDSNTDIDCSSTGYLNEPAGNRLALPRARALLHLDTNTCAQMVDGSIRCWRRNELPKRQDLPPDTTDVKLNRAVNCSLSTKGVVSCWSPPERLHFFSATPTEIQGLHGVDSLVSSGPSFCALQQEAVYCWGENGGGQLGNGEMSEIPSLLPTRVRGVDGATAIGMGGSQGCAAIKDGRVRCWGYAYWGDADPSEVRFSPEVIEGVEGAISIAVGVSHACALVVGGAVTCWGSSEGGQLGAANSTGMPGGSLGSGQRKGPVRVGLSEQAVSIAVGFPNFSCAALRDGKVWCWGSNHSGTLGNGTDVASYQPVEVLGVSDATAVAAGNSYACALTKSGSVWCWGAVGYLGDGADWSTSSIQWNTAVRVRLQAS